MGRCSSTGDPHYTTFDGYSYHFYDRGEVLMVRSFSRDFEVQARTHGGPYSRNCAVAARENNNLAIIDVCDGSLENLLSMCNNARLSGPPETPITSPSFHKSGHILSLNSCNMPKSSICEIIACVFTSILGDLLRGIIALRSTLSSSGRYIYWHLAH